MGDAKKKKDAAEKTKPQRISGEDYWALRDLSKKVDKKREEYQKWVRKRARQEGCYLDQVENVLTGKIRLDPTKECPAGEVKRASDKFLEEAEPKFDELQDVGTKFNDLHEEIAKAYGVTPDRLDPKTGMISPDDTEEATKQKVK